MIFWVVLTRLSAAAIFLGVCYAQHSDVAVKEKRTKYPLKVYNMYKDNFEKKKSKLIGEWSEWGNWTACSRSCGGGITQQTRNCITKSTDNRYGKKQRKRRQNPKTINGCVGLYKRIRLCNTQDCASGHDFRREQCAAFNNRMFRGARYQWEPFLTAKDECALNCRAVGMNFFATLNKTVIDGTSCLNAMTSTGKAAPKGSKGVCFEGKCKNIKMRLSNVLTSVIALCLLVVNSRGVIGSLDDDQEECVACLKGSCRSVSGIYTRPDLPAGYSLVAQIPTGACRVLVQQLKPTRNFLALKNSNGSYIINGDWKFSNSRVFQGAGTKFVYVKQDENSLETLTSPGPLTNPIDIMIVNYQPNLGIKYSYSLPLADGPILAPPLMKRPEPVLETKRLDGSNSLQKDEGAKSVLTSNLHRRTRLRRKHFHWKITGLTACSKSCGGGIQTYVKTCVRDVNPHVQAPVHDKRCSHIDNPASSPLRCNLDPCPASWQFYWTECSATCGDGVQQYAPRCVRATVDGDAQLKDAECAAQPKPAAQTRACFVQNCDGDNELVPSNKEEEDARWTVGSWSQCSVTCGTGHRTRPVTCPTGRCHASNRPAHAEYCNMGASCSEPSPPTSLSQTLHAQSAWLATEWSQCSVGCGTGKQTRFVHCGAEDKSSGCSSDAKPDLDRACSSDRQCNGQWFAGPWGSCSDSCSGRATQKREVLCIVKIRGQSHVTNDMICPPNSKPPEEEFCDGSCPPRWYAGDWGRCEGACPIGVQRRKVSCLDYHGRTSEGCPDDEMPVAKRTCNCQEERSPLAPAQDEPDRACVDRIRKCKVAVQARLCNYPYYTTHCCESCRRAQDYLE